MKYLVVLVFLTLGNLSWSRNSGTSTLENLTREPLFKRESLSKCKYDVAVLNPRTGILKLNISCKNEFHSYAFTSEKPVSFWSDPRWPKVKSVPLNNLKVLACNTSGPRGELLQSPVCAQALQVSRLTQFFKVVGGHLFRKTPEQINDREMDMKTFEYIMSHPQILADVRFPEIADEIDRFYYELFRVGKLRAVITDFPRDFNLEREDRLHGRDPDHARATGLEFQIRF